MGTKIFQKGLLCPDDIKPSYPKVKLLPDKLNLTYSEIRELIKIDYYNFVSQTGINHKVTSQMIRSIPHILGKEKYHKFLIFDGLYNDYLRKVTTHLLRQKKVNNHSIFGPNLSVEEIVHAFKKIDKYDAVDIEDHIIPNRILDSQKKSIQTKPVNMWFPEIYETATLNEYNFIEQLQIFHEFKKRMDRILILDSINVADKYWNKPISEWFSRAFTRTLGNNPACNFPVIVAKRIYELAYEFLNVKSDVRLVVCDTSQGWGGRLIGLLASLSKSNLYSDLRIDYYGTDVNLAIKEQYTKLVKFWQVFINPDVRINNYHSTIPAERLFEDEGFKSIKGKSDIIFTSPPYFNKEKYGLDSEQSYIQYKEYESWSNQFLKPMIVNSFNLLRRNGMLLLNIADISNHKGGYHPLEVDTVKYATEAGFIHYETIKMKMGINQGKNKGNGKIGIPTEKILWIKDKPFKYEPIFVFKKC